MKIYKLDIDAAQPTNQVVQMQQNTAGVLSVNVTKNGNYIRNLSCQMFDGETEISACSAGDKGFKLDIGDTPKYYTVKATATPYECSAEYILSAPEGTSRMKQAWLTKIQLKAGTYRQDEFYSLIRFGDKSGVITILIPHGSDQSKVNFSRINILPWNPQKPVWFHHTNGDVFEPDELVIATEDARIGYSQAYKTTGGGTATLSSTPYPAIGYFVNYQADTLVKPSPNANAFSEIDVLPTEAGFQTLSTDSFTLSGVTYIPTTLSVDGVEYTVLAAPVQTPEPEPDPEQTEG